jgi:hypothetical protein
MVALQAPPPAGTLHQVGERVIISITTKLSLALKVCKLFMFPLSQEQNSILGFASSLGVRRTQKLRNSYNNTMKFLQNCTTLGDNKNKKKKTNLH